jgi:23S rRNA (guanosine2251-2'-O)-methyltransferase
MQPVREAIRVHGGRLSEVLVEGPEGASSRLDALARFARDQGVTQVTRCQREDLERLGRGTAHQGAAAFAPALSLAAPGEVAADPDLVAIALDGIQDPQNFGAIVRSAVAVAGATVVWPENASAPLTPATFRASAGAIEHARLCRVASLPAWLRDLRNAGACIVGLDASAEQPLEDLPLHRPLVIVVGGEHRGLGRSVRASCTALARLSQTHAINSLNASAAAAVALYVSRININKSGG